jgi:hypothetical protein
MSYAPADDAVNWHENIYMDAMEEFVRLIMENPEMLQAEGMAPFRMFLYVVRNNPDQFPPEIHNKECSCTGFPLSKLFYN